MSRRRTLGPSASIGNGHSLDVCLARAIDAMSLLREELRREGLTEPAAVLDQALVSCLKVYVDRETVKDDEG